MKRKKLGLRSKKGGKFAIIANQFTTFSKNCKCLFADLQKMQKINDKKRKRICPNNLNAKN